MPLQRLEVINEAAMTLTEQSKPTAKHTFRPVTRWSRKRYYLYQIFSFAWFVFLFWVWYRYIGSERLPAVWRYLILMVILFLKPSGWIPFEPYERAMKRMKRLELRSTQSELCSHDESPETDNSQ